MNIKVLVDMGMVNIDTDDFAYANIRNMYKGNRNGAGIQLSERLETNRDDITETCDQLSKLLYKLDDLLKDTTK